jgi:hypothetical protein
MAVQLATAAPNNLTWTHSPQWAYIHIIAKTPAWMIL